MGGGFLHEGSPDTILTSISVYLPSHRLFRNYEEGETPHVHGNWGRSQEGRTWETLSVGVALGWMPS